MAEPAKASKFSIESVAVFGATLFLFLIVVGVIPVISR